MEFLWESKGVLKDAITLAYLIAIDAGVKGTGGLTDYLQNQAITSNKCSSDLGGLKSILSVSGSNTVLDKGKGSKMEFGMAGNEPHITTLGRTTTIYWHTHKSLQILLQACLTGVLHGITTVMPWTCKKDAVAMTFMASSQKASEVNHHCQMLVELRSHRKPLRALHCNIQQALVQVDPKSCWNCLGLPSLIPEIQPFLRGILDNQMALITTRTEAYVTVKGEATKAAKWNAYYKHPMATEMYNKNVIIGTVLLKKCAILGLLEDSQHATIALHPGTLWKVYCMVLALPTLVLEWYPLLFSVNEYEEGVCLKAKDALSAELAGECAWALHIMGGVMRKWNVTDPWNEMWKGPSGFEDTQIFILGLV
ncbi:hypothetical protein EDD16DRAFT_1518616 [Pisolithus croceorrhizus]|nr:hypothetical protein EV401DRAFT_1893118 [Pisolithus croceorrhizus]KAI6120943.1 hypothetical protein EDD16DRAFT_1518616 [Pisolithus croceorrhizus]KAI6152792.1 hypothetical protein EDD17DRAFT_1513222 [Pisolithus thermaeus]